MVVLQSVARPPGAVRFPGSFTHGRAACGCPAGREGELGGTVLSVIILQVTGSDEAIDAVVLYLNEHHITWEYVTP